MRHRSSALVGRRRASLLVSAFAVVASSVHAQSGTSAAQRPPAAGVSAGRLQEFVVQDSLYGRARRVWVYTPPGYDARAARPYALLVAFDGDEYRDTMPLPMVLDTLLATHRTPPLVALLVDDGSGATRLADLANHERFARLLGDQLIPWLRARYAVTRDPRRTMVTGSSAGGLAAAYVAFKRPDLFGNVFSQSGAFWRGDEGANGDEWLTSAYATAPKRDVRFVLDVGSGETHRVLGGTGPVFIEANRRMRDVLRRKGYDVQYTEVPAGQHAPVFWRERLGAGIAALTREWAP